MPRSLLTTLLAVPLLVGCPAADDSTPGIPGDAVGPAGPVPTFTLAWSEYPSWSVFGVAAEEGLIDGAEGELGELEEKWEVDVVLKQADYDPCLTMYAGGQVDAVCITNIDALAPSAGRDSVAILPTSTSVGGDACIAAGVADLAALKGVPTHGLEKSVSQYVFERVLESKGENPAEYPFQNKDPAVAAQAMQGGDADVRSIMVWNPYALQTERGLPEAKRLFDSSAIPEEVIDMVVVSKDSLKKPGGEAFAHCLIDTYYEFCKKLDGGDRDELVVALGAKFSTLGLEDMNAVLEQTKLYRTPAAALKLMGGGAFKDVTMPRVVKFAEGHDMLPSSPTVGFADANTQLNFDPRYIEAVADQQ